MRFTEKKDLYARVFARRSTTSLIRTASRSKASVWRGLSYQPIPPDTEGRLRSEQLGASFGFWRGVVEGRTADWVRLFRSDGDLVPTPAEAEALRADAERQRAEAAEAELARLRALLDQR